MGRMKISRLKLEYFKQFRDKDVDFCDPVTGLPRDLIVLLGPNGSGKSTVLQAIASVLGTATRRIRSPRELNWPGFEFELCSNAWTLPFSVALDVWFSETEREATRRYFHEVPGLKDRDDVVEPDRKSTVGLTMMEGRDEPEALTAAEKFQFRGREYAKQVLRTVPEGHGVFKEVGFVFWYTEDRVSTTLTPYDTDRGPIQYDIDTLRRRLADLMQFHERVERGDYQLRPGQRDLFAELEDAYRAVFPDRQFEGPVIRNEIDDVLQQPWFYLYDGVRQYELSEMSGGERAVFPMLFDFVNWQINRSVVLIDELELHLHPPMQQALLKSLAALGEDNQFIITTHSEAVEAIVPEASIIRLEEE